MTGLRGKVRTLARSAEPGQRLPRLCPAGGHGRIAGMQRTCRPCSPSRRGLRLSRLWRICRLWRLCGLWGICGLWGLCLLLVSCQREPPGPPGGARRATAYDAYRRPEQLVAALHLAPGEQIAEIGAGSGYLTGRLAQAVGPAGRVVATDIDDAALAVLKERTRGLAQVEVRRVTAREPGLEPGRYDLILLAQVDHLLADRLVYLRALPKALKPGGRIALSNSVRYQEPLRAALTAGGFRWEATDAQLPGQFLIMAWPQ